MRSERKVQQKEGSKNAGFPQFILWISRQKVYCLIELELTLNLLVFFFCVFLGFGYKISDKPQIPSDNLDPASTLFLKKRKSNNFIWSDIWGYWYIIRYIQTGQIPHATTTSMSWICHRFCLYVYFDLDHGDKTLGQGHDTRLGCNIIQIQHDNEKLWPGYRLWICMHYGLDLGDMTSALGNGIPMGHRQQLCENLSKSNIEVRSYNPDTHFGHVCTVTLTLEVWP